MTPRQQTEIYRGYEVRHGGHMQGFVVYLSDSPVKTLDTLDQAYDWIDAEKRKQNG